MIDHFLPEYHFVERHSRWIPAAPARVLGATRAVRARDARLAAPLLFIRGLPALLLGRPVSSVTNARGKPMLDFFTPLAASADEVVAGIVGRFWQLKDIQTRRIKSPEEFLAFDDPTYAKSVINFRVLPVDGGTLLTTETRVLVPDPSARRRFGRYWSVVLPGSALIRRSLLAAIARRATGGAKPS